ncbi:MAG: BON domain-containing protein [Alphaproteobacteria bacterium]
MIKYLSLLGVSLLALNGCTAVGLATGLGASVGVAAAQEGGLSRAASDLRIQAQINDLWFKHDTAMFTKLDMTIRNGRVLLTGVVQDPEHRVEAVRLAWQPEGVSQVINEIQVAESGGIKQYALDTWISGRLRAALTFDKDVQSINYTIDTVNGIVYLMGVAQSQLELNRVTEIARSIDNVTQVVSYVKIVEAQGGGTVSSENTGFQPRDAERVYAPNDASVEVYALPEADSGSRMIEAAPVDDAIESETLLWNDR